ncbi:target of Nesh-SH3-like isoform X4 [Gouania willdenowi]|uniref:target of Nesh-SH3-like isoform X4 n=1 Tax=Gouania willdenowi TaxID=441366 RepID=UPI001054C251|nr:target of Nesh-SH3 isoform X4 [Gouania willdenowi]
MQQHSNSLLLLLLLVLITGIVVCSPSTPRRSRVRRQNMKVRITATEDTIVMKFLRPHPNTKLEGYVLGYGSSIFSKQFIPLPEKGQPYMSEMDAEPKYLVAVQPIPTNKLKKHCTGKVQLEKPLHLVIGSVSPTSVLLSWGTLLKTPYDVNVMNECIEDGHYTVRYREKSRKWNYQTCPTSDTIIDNLKPNMVYEFGVQPSTKEGTGDWSRPLYHNISSTVTKGKVINKTLNRPTPPVKPLTPGPNSVPFSPQHVVHNKTVASQPLHRITSPKTSIAPTTTTRKAPVSTSGPTRSPVIKKQPIAIGGAHHRGNAHRKSMMRSKDNPVMRQAVHGNKRPNQVGKPSDHDKPMLKQGDKESILKPFPLVTVKPKQERRLQTTTPNPSLNSTHFDINENSSIFRPLPASDVDFMGKKRFVAPHVIYKTDKKPDEPCSITSSLTYFPEEEGGDQNVTSPPKVPPSNLTVVTVEGCPSFVILDWEKSDNETREYEVVSTSKGPNGQQVSVQTTNQTHTAVENLKPSSSYEFKVTPKNELGSGPSTDPVSFSTESADPRVSEYVSGKGAIWTQFPFKADSHSECNGKQYVKRTWYRKFVGIQLCNSLRYKIYLSDSLNGKFYNIGDQTGFGEDHCQFVDSFLDGRTGSQMTADQLPSRPGYFRALRQEPVNFGEIGGKSHVTYVGWYECGTPIPGKW